MSKNVKFKVEKRSYPKNSAIVDIDVDDGVQEVTFGGDTCLDVDLYDVKKQFPDVKRLIIKNNIASISISNFIINLTKADLSIVESDPISCATCLSNMKATRLI